MPIATVLQMEKEVKENKKRLFFEYFYEFMKGLNLCVQNSIRSDRQFMQTLDFDIRIYNTPVRLNAYYNAFIYQMKRFLNMAGPASQPQEHEYEFLTCLGVTDNVKVRELFRNMSDGKRLFLVSIPENQTYDMRLMMVMLGHEVGHFVGQALRNREYRYSCAIQLMAKITAAYIRHKLEKNKMYGQLVHCDYIEVDEYWRRFDSKLETYLKVHMDKLGNLEYLKKYRYRKDSEIEETLLKEICEVYTKYQNYTFLLKETLPDAVSDVLGRYRRKLFDYLLEKEYLFCLENGSSQDDAARQRQTLSEIIGDIVKEITGYSVWEKRKFSIVSATEMMLSLFKECEADLVAILTLKLSLRDYLYAIWKSMEDQGYQEGKMPVEVVIRSGLITCCMFHLDDTKSGEYYWGQDELKKIQEEESAKVQKMVINIVNFKDCFFSVEGREQEEFNIKNTVDGFLNGAVLEIILRYLLKCRSTFEETFESRKKGECSQRLEECVELQEKLIGMYSLCQKKNVEKLIWDLQEHIEKHKKLLEAEIDRHIKNVKEDK